MASVGTPAETRDFILERLIGDTGEPERVANAAQAVGERALGGIAQGINEALSISLDVEVNRVDLTRFAEARPEPASHSAMVIAASPSSPDALVMVIDPAAISLIVAATFGADPDLPLDPIDRDPSPLEIELISTVFDAIATALNGHGPRALEIRFPLPGPIAGPELKKLALRDTPAVRIVFSVACGANRGEISVVIPQRVLLKHRAEGGNAGASASSAAWGARFGEEVMRSAVEVVATMPIGRLTLGELSALSVGQVVPFEEGSQSSVQLAARGRTLFTCEFGRLGNNFTVRVRDAYQDGSDLIDGLLPANHL